MTLEKFKNLIKELESKDLSKCQQIAELIIIEINKYLNKRKNIFTILKLDHHDKANIENFNKSLFRNTHSSFKELHHQFEDDTEEIKIDDSL